MAGTLTIEYGKAPTLTLAQIKYEGVKRADRTLQSLSQDLDAKNKARRVPVVR
jgi:hypothetical protein